MRIDGTTTFWVVTDARPGSTLPDVCHQTTLEGLRRRFAAGLGMEEQPVLHLDEEAAHEDARNRLLALRAAAWIRRQRHLPADEVVRITLHDRDGREVYRGDIQ